MLFSLSFCSISSSHFGPRNVRNDPLFVRISLLFLGKPTFSSLLFSMSLWLISRKTPKHQFSVFKSVWGIHAVKPANLSLPARLSAFPSAWHLIRANRPKTFNGSRPVSQQPRADRAMFEILRYYYFQIEITTAREWWLHDGSNIDGHIITILTLSASW